MKKHYATHVEDTDKLISVAGPILEYETWYEQYKKLMEEQAQRKYGLYTPTSEGGDDFDPSSFDQAWTVAGKTNEDSDRATITNITGNGNDLKLTNFGFAEGSGYNQEGEYAGYLIPEEIKKQMSIDSPRYNVYNTKIIMHLTHYETLFPSDMKIDGEEITEPTYPFPVYTSPSLEFSNLLASEEWSSNEEEYDI